MDLYPVFKDKIQEGIKRGIPIQIIGSVLREQEQRVNFIGNQEQVQKLFGRTPETQNNTYLYEQLGFFDALKKANPDRSEQDIFNAIEMSQQTGINVQNLLTHRDVYKYFIGNKPENESLMQSAIRGWKNYNTTNARGELGLTAMREGWDAQRVSDEAAKIEQQMIPEPAITTLAGRTLAGASSIMAQGLKNQAKGLLTAGLVKGALSLYPATKPFATPAARTAYMVANGWELFEDQAGNDYIDLLRIKDVDGKPLDKNVAKATAAITGAITVGIEMGTLQWALNAVPWGGAVKNFLGMNKQTVIDAVRSNPIIRHHLAQIGKDMVGGITISTLNNIAEAFNTGMKSDLANAIGNQTLVLDPDRHKKMWEDVRHAAGTAADFTLTSLLGLAWRLPEIYKQTRTYQTMLTNAAQVTGVPATELEHAVAEGIQANQEAQNEVKAEDNVRINQKEIQHIDPLTQATAALENLTKVTKATEQVLQGSFTAEDKANYVFFPTAVLQDFISKNEDVDLQGTIETGTETGITKEQYERLKAEHPDFINENSNSIRMGANGVTADEAMAKVKNTDQQQAEIYHSSEIQSYIQQTAAEYVKAGETPEKAEAISKLAGAVVAGIQAKTGFLPPSIAIKTADTTQEQWTDMSRLNPDYDITNPATWTDQNRTQRLLNATQGLNLSSLDMIFKQFFDEHLKLITPEQLADVELPEGADRDTITSVVKEEAADYKRTLRTANQDAVEALAASTWDAERYDVGSKMPRGKTRNPDARYQSVDHDGRTDIDLAVDNKGDNLSVRVKNPKNKNPFVLTIKNFRQADLTQVLGDLADNIGQKADWLLNAPIVKNIGLALLDFWHEQGLEENTEPVRLKVQTTDIDSIERTQPAEIQIHGEEIQKPTVDIEGERIARPEKVSTQTLPAEVWGKYPEVHQMEIPQPVIPSIHEDTAKAIRFSEAFKIADDTGMQDRAAINLYDTSQVWDGTALDIATDSTKTSHSNTESYVMQAPLVLSLAGVDTQKIVAMKDSKINATKESILQKHPTITLQQIQDAPKALANPIAIFQSSPTSTNPFDGRIVLTDMTDSNGASIVIALDTNHKAATKAIGVSRYVQFASMYPQAAIRGKKKGQPNNQWFQDEVAAGRLLYVNTEKAAQWAISTGIDLIPQGFDLSTVKTEADLNALWSNPQNEGLYKVGPDGKPITSVKVNTLGELGRSIVNMFTKPGDPKNTTAHVHDIGHTLMGLIEAFADEGHQQMTQDRDYIIQRAGVTLDEWLAESPNQKGGAREKVHEWFADAFEVYLTEGATHQDKELQSVFDRIKDFLIEIYTTIMDIPNVQLNDKDRELFHRLLDMPVKDSDTVSQFANLNNNTQLEISRLEEIKRSILEQQHKDIQASEQDIADADIELDDDTVNAVQNYVDTDSDFEQVYETFQNTASVVTARGTEVQVRYRIVDADSLITSHNDKGQINPDYSQELQPRQRERAASSAQIHHIAQHLDPRRLGDNINASEGAPIIGPDMMVESGNGRTLAIREAYSSGKADKYRQWLIDNAYQFALSPSEAANLEHPVLVRERLTEVDRAKFAAEANESSIAGMSTIEQAFKDANNITPEMLLLFDPAKSLSDNTDFISAFAKIVPDNEINNFIQKNGDISRAGLDRIISALMAKAYSNSELIDSISESYDNTAKNISNALIAAAPSMAVLNHSNHDIAILIAGDIARAVEIYTNIKREGSNIDAWLAQPVLFKDADISPEVKTLLQFFNRNKNSYKRIASGLIYYANTAMNEAQIEQPLLFEDSKRTKDQILSEAIRVTEETADTSNVVEPVSSAFFDKITSGKATPTIPINQNTFNTFLAITGPEGALTYLKKRKSFLKRSKKSTDYSGEIERIDSYIQQVNELYADQLKKKNTNIKTQDLRKARHEGFTEGEKQGRSIQREKQKEILAQLRERHAQEMKDLKLSFREQRIQDRADILRAADEAAAYVQSIQTAQAADALQQTDEQIAQIKEQDKAKLLEAKEKGKTKLQQAKEHTKTRLQETRDFYKQKLEQHKQKAKEHETAKLDKANQRSEKKISKLQERIDFLKNSIRERNNKQGISRSIKRIIAMSKSKYISWARHQDIMNIIDTIDFRKSKEAHQYKQLLEQFFYSEDAEDSQWFAEQIEDITQKDITQDEVNNFVDKIRLGDMTLAEVKGFVEEISALFQQGKREYAIWKQQQQDRRSNMTSRLTDAFSKKWKAPKNEGQTIPKELQDISRKYLLGRLGEYSVAFGDYVQTPRRFLSMLGDAFTDILFDTPTQLRNEAYSHIHQRNTFVLEGLKQLGINPTDLMKTAVHLDGNNYSWSNVMAIWAYMQNDFARDAVVYGNFMSNQANPNKLYATYDEAMTAITKILDTLNQPEGQKYRQAMQLMMKDFENNIARIEDAYIRDRNEGFGRQENYFPIQRMRHQTSGGFTIDTETEKILEADKAGKLFQRPDDGFTQERIKINPQKQQPINLNAFKIWHDNMTQQEFLAALGGWGADVFSALTTSGSEFGSVQDLILQRAGRPAWQIIKSIYNNTITEDAYAEAQAADKFFGYLTQARSFAMVAYAPVSVAAQFSSFFLTWPITNRLHLFRSLAKAVGLTLTGRGKYFRENVYNMYPELRFSTGDPVTRVTANARKYGSLRGWGKYISLGYKAVGALDNWTKRVVFDAVYQSRLGDGMTHEQAVQEAIHAVQDTQPASTSREMTEFNKSRGLLKYVFFQFMNALAPVFNVGVVDVARNIIAPNMNNIKSAAFSLLGTGLAIAASGVTKDWWNGKLPTGEEQEDGTTDSWYNWFVNTEIENFLNTVPILNSVLVEWYKASNGKRHYSSNRIFEPFTDVARWWKSFQDTDNEEGTDWSSLLGGASKLVLPIPYNALKQWGHIFRLDKPSKPSD